MGNTAIVLDPEWMCGAEPLLPSHPLLLGTDLNKKHIPKCQASMDFGIVRAVVTTMNIEIVISKW